MLSARLEEGRRFEAEHGSALFTEKMYNRTHELAGLLEDIRTKGKKQAALKRLTKDFGYERKDINELLKKFGALDAEIRRVKGIEERIRDELGIRKNLESEHSVLNKSDVYDPKNGNSEKKRNCFQTREGR